MAHDLTEIRNIGPAMAAALRAAGIVDAPGLRSLGADAAYARLLSHGARPHFIAYYALVMGLQGRPWNDCRGAEKTALRARFDALRARPATAGDVPAGVEAALDALGLPRPPRGRPDR